MINCDYTLCLYIAVIQIRQMHNVQPDLLFIFQLADIDKMIST